MKISLSRASAVALLLCSLTTHAADEPPQPRWELGAFGMAVSQQAYPGANEHTQRFLLLPYAVLRDRHWRADGEGAGLRALRTPEFELDVGFAASLGSGSRDALEARRGLPRLGTLVEMGPRLKWNLGPAPGGGRWQAVLPVRGVFDLNDHLASRGWAAEPEWIYLRRSESGWRYSVGLGAVWANRRLAGTFYDVTPEQALPDRPAYHARAGLLGWRLSSGFNKALTRDWRLFGFARLESVSGAANRDSSLVRQSLGVSAGVGLSYTFARSSEPGEE